MLKSPLTYEPHGVASRRAVAAVAAAPRRPRTEPIGSRRPSIRPPLVWQGPLQGSRLCTFPPTRSAFEAGIKRETPKFITSPEFRISRNRPEVSTSIHGACGRKMRANRSEGLVAKRRYASLRFSCLDIASGPLTDFSWPFPARQFPGFDWIAINYNLESTNNSP